MKSINYLQSPWKTIAFAISAAKKRFILMCTLLIIGNILGASTPYIFKLIVERVTEPNTTPTFRYALSPVLLLGIIMLIRELCYRTGHAIEVYVATDAFRHITQHLYSNLIRRPASYFENKFSGDLGRRIEQVGNAILYFTEQFPWEIAWVGMSILMGFVILSFTHPYVLIAFTIWAILFVSTSVPLIMWHHRESQPLATSHANLSGTMVDTLSNVSLVHSFGGTSYEEERQHIVLGDLTQKERAVRWITVISKFQQGMSILLLCVGLMGMSVFLFTKQQFTVGDFVVVAAIIPALIGVIWNAGDIILRTSRHFAELTDAVAHLRERQEQLLGGTIEHGTVKKYPINFRKVAFQYPGTDHPVLKNFSIKIEQGEHVGIVGISGAGKSTLIKLLLRQYEPQSGTIAIGNVSLSDFTLPAFNKLISYVPQDTSLFHRTLFENISYANPGALEEAVFKASREAHAEEFILTLPEGYETKVGERGVKLSGGQRQRIALARAILKDAPILVLDEATSSLDTESETLIQDALGDLFKNRTVIAIAHRLSTLRAMDRIIVMQDGDIVESGSPQELLVKESGVFKQMWEHQKNGFI